MSHKTIFTCDRCGEKFNAPTSVWIVGITVERYGRSEKDKLGKWKPLNSEVVLKKDWCEQCLAATGLINEFDLGSIPGAKHPRNMPTFEELFAELVKKSLVKIAEGENEG